MWRQCHALPPDRLFARPFTLTRRRLVHHLHKQMWPRRGHVAGPKNLFLDPSSMFHNTKAICRRNRILNASLALWVQSATPVPFFVQRRMLHQFLQFPFSHLNEHVHVRANTPIGPSNAPQARTSVFLMSAT